jgi:hypothetical protein
MTGEEDQRRSFKVQDRRRFSESGDARPDADDGSQDPRNTANPPGPPPAEPHGHDEAVENQQRETQLPELNFATFVMSLSTQALAHLGEIPDPVEGTMRVDLIAARQMIDILAILRDKTTGNLDNAENSLLESALYDLRMKYVEKARR